MANGERHRMAWAAQAPPRQYFFAELETGATLAALNEALDALRKPLEASAVAKAKAEKFAKFDALASSEDRPIKPERVVKELSKALDADAIVVADPGTPCPYLSAYYPIRKPGRTLFSNRAHGALGYSMAAAVGAHYGRPSVKTVAVPARTWRSNASL